MSPCPQGSHILPCSLLPPTHPPFQPCLPIVIYSCRDWGAQSFRPRNLTAASEPNFIMSDLDFLSRVPYITSTINAKKGFLTDYYYFLTGCARKKKRLYRPAGRRSSAVVWLHSFKGFRIWDLFLIPNHLNLLCFNKIATFSKWSRITSSTIAAFWNCHFFWMSWFPPHFAHHLFPLYDAPICPYLWHLYNLIGGLWNSFTWYDKHPTNTLDGRALPSNVNNTGEMGFPPPRALNHFTSLTSPPLRFSLISLFDTSAQMP